MSAHENETGDAFRKMKKLARSFIAVKNQINELENSECPASVLNLQSELESIEKLSTLIENEVHTYFISDCSVELNKPENHLFLYLAF